MVRFRRSKGRHLNPVPDLPPAEGSLPPAERSGRDAGRAALRLVGEGEQETLQPTIDAAPGTPIDILDVIMELNERLKGEGADANVYKLEQVFLLLAQMATSRRSIEDIVGDDEFGSRAGSKETAYTAARLYDGLEALREAFEYARSDSHTGQRHPARLDRFIRQILPSEAWENPAAKGLILQGIDEAYALCSQSYHQYSNSIDGYISRMQAVLAEHGMGLKPVSDSASYTQRRDHEISKQRIIDEAWEDWIEKRSGR
ncbi:MAG TPA: hypothetical protein VG964_00290 [Candidatus Saccharimonadales bacterium]|nr:hypothetical protein [Candidatus Saccharimonadales bacterium]